MCCDCELGNNFSQGCAVEKVILNSQSGCFFRRRF